MNITGCPAEALSADFGDITVTGVSERLDFKVTFEQKEILQETYYPDSAGAVYIRDLALLADMYRPDDILSEDAAYISGTVTLSLEFKEGNQVQAKTVSLYACEVETGGTLTPAQLKNIPLSRCFNKTVSPEQTEYISFYGSGTVTLLLIHTGEGSDRSQFMAFATLPDNGLICRLDVSPAVIAGRAGIDRTQIVYYILYKDKDFRIKFTMNSYLRPGKTFLFSNAFGAQETFTCYGDSKNERKWTRQFGQVNRKQHQIYRTAESTSTVNSGYLTREQAETVEDLLNARQIALIDPYGWHPVVIAEEKFEVTSRPDELINIEFKYRPAAGNQLQYRFDPSKYRIFIRPPFEKTYN
jgi:hypothetical protein